MRLLKPWVSTALGWLTLASLVVLALFGLWGAPPDRIHLYRQAILAEWCETGVGFDDLVAHVTIHEIGHHFGLSDADMHALEDTVSG